MDYEEFIKGQLEDENIDELNNLMKNSIEDEGIFDYISAEEIVNRLLNGQPIIDSGTIIDRFIDFFLSEIKEVMILGCEIIIICIVIGLLVSFSDTISNKGVCKLGEIICGVCMTALCISSFYNTYDYCFESVDTMTLSMEVLLPVMIPLLISSGGLSSGTIMDPVMLAAVTGFNFILQHIVLPMIFLSVMFILINSITEKDYIKKLSIGLRRCGLFITGLIITLFSGIMAVQGIVYKSADNIIMNTARFSIDNFIPFVGGFTADSLDMIINCIALIKNSIGIMGMIIIVSTIIVPIIKMIAIALVYKITAIVAEPIATKNISDGLNEIGSAAVIITVVLLAAAIMFLIFITVLMSLGGR